MSEQEIMQHLAKNNVIRKIDIDKENARRQALADLARDMKQTPTFDHLDQIARRKKEREDNQRNPNKHK